MVCNQNSSNLFIFSIFLFQFGNILLQNLDFIIAFLYPLCKIAFLFNANSSNCA